MKRPHIPVRDGLQLPFRPRFLPTTVVDFGAGEYRKGFWFGYGAGLCWGAILVGIASCTAWPQKNPYTPVYEKDTSLLVGWCGGPVPKSIPQGEEGVDVTWWPKCPKK